jgi:hypothetical protein
MSYVFEMTSPIGVLLKMLMQEKRVKPRDLIKATKLSRYSVYRHVSGKIEPDMTTRQVYAELFGLEFAEFEHRWQEIEQATAVQATRMAAKKNKRPDREGLK